MKDELLRLVALLFFGSFFIFPCTAHAYLDPGTGSMLLQFLAAGFLALGVFWRRIIGCFNKLFRFFFGKS